MRHSAGKAHDHRMPEATPFTRKVNQHRRFPVSGLERMDCSEKKRQAKGHFMSVFMHGWSRGEKGREATLLVLVR